MILAQSRSGLARLIPSLIVACLVAGASSRALAQSDDIEGAKINWHKYMQYASSASAIAMALSYVDHCSKKLDIQEGEMKDPKSGDNLVVLSFSCGGNEDEEGSVYLRFFGQRKDLEQGPPHGPPMLKDIVFAG